MRKKIFIFYNIEQNSIVFAKLIKSPSLFNVTFNDSVYYVRSTSHRGFANNHESQ